MKAWVFIVIVLISLISYKFFPNIAFKGRIRFKIALVSDTDDQVPPGQAACSEFLEGIVVWDPNSDIFSVNFKKSPLFLCSDILFGNRGMELSDVIYFDGKLLTVDDKTGIIYQIFRENSTVSVWTRLADGDGTTNEFFKGEWSTIKNGKLYVGGYGKVYTGPSGAVLSERPMWIKIVSRTGSVRHVDWRENYLALSARLSIYHPGYVIHESAAWSHLHKLWFFMPRAVSWDPYMSGGEASAGANYMLIADERFAHIDVVHVGTACKTRGFSAFRFVPNTKDTIIMALKTEEKVDSLSTYFLIFDLTGRILHEETKFADSKYEGLEFLF